MTCQIKSISMLLIVFFCLISFLSKVHEHRKLKWRLDCWFRSRHHGIKSTNVAVFVWEAGSRYNLVPLSFYHIVWTDMELPRSSNEQWHVLSGRSVVRGINSCQDGTNKRACSSSSFRNRSTTVIVCGVVQYAWIQFAASWILVVHDNWHTEINLAQEQ